MTITRLQKQQIFLAILIRNISSSSIEKMIIIIPVIYKEKS